MGNLCCKREEKLIDNSVKCVHCNTSVKDSKLFCVKCFDVMFQLDEIEYQYKQMFL